MLWPLTNAWYWSRADLELAGDQRSDVLARRGALAAADDGLDTGHHLLGMGRLADPVVGAEPQAADPLGDGRLRGADEHAQAGDRAADLLEELPALGPEHGEVDQQGVQLHRHQLLDRDGAREHAVLPAGAIKALAEDGEESAVGVDHRQP